MNIEWVQDALSDPQTRNALLATVFVAVAGLALQAIKKTWSYYSTRAECGEEETWAKKLKSSQTDFYDIIMERLDDDGEWNFANGDTDWIRTGDNTPLYPMYEIWVGDPKKPAQYVRTNSEWVRLPTRLTHGRLLPWPTEGIVYKARKVARQLKLRAQYDEMFNANLQHAQYAPKCDMDGNPIVMEGEIDGVGEAMNKVAFDDTAVEHAVPAGMATTPNANKEPSSLEDMLRGYMNKPGKSN